MEPQLKQISPNSMPCNPSTSLLSCQQVAVNQADPYDRACDTLGKRLSSAASHHSEEMMDDLEQSEFETPVKWRCVGNDAEVRSQASSGHKAKRVLFSPHTVYCDSLAEKLTCSSSVPEYYCTTQITKKMRTNSDVSPISSINLTSASKAALTTPSRHHEPNLSEGKRTNKTINKGVLSFFNFLKKENEQKVKAKSLNWGFDFASDAPMSSASQAGDDSPQSDGADKNLFGAKFTAEERKTGQTGQTGQTDTPVNSCDNDDNEKNTEIISEKQLIISVKSSPLSQ